MNIFRTVFLLIFWGVASFRQIDTYEWSIELSIFMGHMIHIQALQLIFYLFETIIYWALLYLHVQAISLTLLLYQCYDDQKMYLNLFKPKPISKELLTGKFHSVSSSNVIQFCMKIDYFTYFNTVDSLSFVEYQFQWILWIKVNHELKCSKSLHFLQACMQTGKTMKSNIQENIASMHEK